MRKLTVTLLLTGGCLLGIGTAAAQAATPPVAAISFPPSGGTYTRGEFVATRFGCTDPTGPGISSCRDSNGAPAPDGHLITRSLGNHTYRVTALSKDGMSRVASIHYTVVANCATATRNGFNAGFQGGFQSGFQTEFRAAYTAKGAWQVGFKSGFAARHRRRAVRHSARAAVANVTTAAQAQAVASAVPSGCVKAFNTAFNQGFNTGFNSGFNAAFNSAFQLGYRAGFSAR